MKIGCYSDIHLSRNDINLSEANSHNIFESILWARQVFKDEGCELIINNGDFLDGDTIDAETNYIIREVYKNNKQKELLLCGNHEIKDKDAKYNSLNILDNYPNLEVINKIRVIKLDNITLVLQPYTNNEKHINKLIDTLDKIEGKKVLFSHLTYRNVPNIYMSDAIKGEIDYRKVEDKVNLIFNGHIHNALESQKYVQVGILTGLSFSDDYDKYKPGIIIFDTDKMSFKRIENPNAILYVKTNYNNLDLENLQRTYLRIDCPSNKIEEIQHKLDKLNVFRYKLKLILENNQNAQEIIKQDFNLYSDPTLALRDFIKTETGIYTTEQLNTFINEYYEEIKLQSKEVI